MTKTYRFALDVIRLCKKLKNEKEFEIAKQFLRSGTSIGANIEEAQGAQSKKDFIHKVSISYKETRESIYWLKLLIDSKIISDPEDLKLLEDAKEIQKIISSILITSKGS